MRIDKLLRKLEWSSSRQGIGSGYMGSGGDGPLFPACPICGGLKEANNHFNEDSVGHREHCELAEAIKLQRRKAK